MLPLKFAQKFARDWATAWNEHDLEAVLAYYTHDFVIETPMPFLRLAESSGRLASKEAAKAYWQISLEQVPNLEFKNLNVLTGINTLTIYYPNKATNQKAAEILFFNEDLKVCKAFVHYS